VIDRKSDCTNAESDVTDVSALVWKSKQGGAWEGGLANLLQEWEWSRLALADNRLEFVLI
jgi:hypothetical protein